MRGLVFLLPIGIMMSCGQAGQVNGTSGPTEKTADQYILARYTADEAVYFVNPYGETVIPTGKYVMAFSDTIRNMGTVLDTTGRFLAINYRDSVLFEVYNFDNGPDYVEEGLFRIVENGLIGYASETGDIVIRPRYKCAFPFENGSAKVSTDCTETIEFEMKRWDSENWFYIDKQGHKVDPETLKRLSE